ncbi:Mitochondrial copper homeostasis protein [Ciborinia camelliae]|nr:Mitochondrial copper homeostasis protein [Ciborinia camelliae]
MHLNCGKEFQDADFSPSSKRPGEYFDPCQEAATRSLKCLARNGGDRDMCTDYFQAYRDCKKLWIEQRKEAKKKAGWFS